MNHGLRAAGPDREPAEGGWGGGHPQTPATPCIRVRTRRFESVTLTLSNNDESPSDFKYALESPIERALARARPRTVSASSRITGKPRTYPQFQHSRLPKAGVFHCCHKAPLSRNRTHRVGKSARLAHSGEAERSFWGKGELSSMTDGTAPDGSSFSRLRRLCKRSPNLLIMRLAILFGGLISAVPIAQDPSAKPAFKVVSIRPAVRPTMYSGGIEDGPSFSDPERLSAHGIVLEESVIVPASAAWLQGEP